MSGTANVAAVPFTNAPYTLHAYPLEIVIFKPYPPIKDFTVDTVKELPDNLVQIETTHHFKDGVVQKGTFRFHRNLCWAIKEGSWGKPAGVTIYSRCEYEDKLDAATGCPLIKSMSARIDYGERISDKKDYTITALNFSPPPQEDFDFHRFVDIGLPNSSPLGIVRVACIVFGILLIIIAVLMRVFKK
ncbi:MAG: hypothetical protein LBT46_04595 [Planctomycetaceae bacterium]|nr:hypothetical protein [Planctomycetaceae bacterium]